MELYHHGILGQNKDGSLTNAGRKRYLKTLSIRVNDTKYRRVIIAEQKEVAKEAIKRYSKKEELMSLANERNKMLNELQNNPEYGNTLNKRKNELETLYDPVKGHKKFEEAADYVANKEIKSKGLDPNSAEANNIRNFYVKGDGFLDDAERVWLNYKYPFSEKTKERIKELSRVENNKKRMVNDMLSEVFKKSYDKAAFVNKYSAEDVINRILNNSINEDDYFLWRSLDFSKGLDPDI